MTKIAVSASGPDLEARVDPRFGRAPYFLLINPDTLEFEALANQENLQAARGATFFFTLPRIAASEGNQPQSPTWGRNH
jgi:predicted Fe-Mo cluster-binding NifX family protein